MSLRVERTVSSPCDTMPLRVQVLYYPVSIARITIEIVNTYLSLSLGTLNPWGDCKLLNSYCSLPDTPNNKQHLNPDPPPNLNRKS